MRFFLVAAAAVLTQALHITEVEPKSFNQVEVEADTNTEAESETAFLHHRLGNHAQTGSGFPRPPAKLRRRKHAQTGSEGEAQRHR